MIILPAIDILNGKCVQLVRGEYDTAAKVAENPVETAKYFADCGAEYIHMVDLDGAKSGEPINAEIFTEVAKSINIPVELGGGIRNMKTADYYLNNGISRVILGSVVLTDKKFAEEAVLKYGEKIAVGIDAQNRKVKTSGWIAGSEVDFIDLAREMAEIGVKNIIYTDISKDGTLTGINLEHYKELKEVLPPAVNITASGGGRSMDDIMQLCSLDIYGAICGTSIYSGTLNLKVAVEFTKNDKIKKFLEVFKKNELIPAIIQDYTNGEVLQLGYMNEESFKLTLETKRTWFYSRSRQKLWNKGETSGHFQNVKEIYYDCFSDKLLIKAEQIGAACHTGNRSCFYSRLY